MVETERGLSPTAHRLIEILERQRQDLVVRVLKKHEEVKAGEEFIDKVLASLSDIFLLLTGDFQLAQANQEFYRALGYRTEETTTLTLEDLVGRTNAAAIRLALEKKELTSMETSLLDRSGNAIPVNLRGSTCATPSGNVAHILIAVNKSDFHAMVGRMHEAQEQLLHSVRLASLGEMAAGIGHELTQPLNAILLFSRNCLKLLHDPVQHKALLEENLNIIVDRVNKASSIIHSLKSFAGKTEDELSPVNVNTVLVNILNFLQPQLVLSEVHIELLLDDNLPLILGQEVKLEQIFLNLIQNGLQAMGKVEQPVMTIQTCLQTQLEPETLQEKAFVSCLIRDNGEGIAPDIQKKIFDPFFTTREVGTGMGLGLSIVNRIVQDLSGFIRVEGCAGGGTTFIVHIPPWIDHRSGDQP